MSRGRYFDLEQGSDRLRLDLAWEEVVGGKKLTILDEAQSWPRVFERLRGAIDDDRKRVGRVLLLGSVSPALMTQVSESLAGRLSLVELTPLLITELETIASRERRWLCGGYPDGGVLRPRAYEKPVRPWAVTRRRCGLAPPAGRSPRGVLLTRAGWGWGAVGFAPIVFSDR